MILIFPYNNNNNEFMDFFVQIDISLQNQARFLIRLSRLSYGH